MHIRLATIQDYHQLQDLYRGYYAEGHPLYHQPFWEWMFTNPSYGQCLIAANEQQEIIGHMGAIHGGGLVWLVNILVSPAYRQQNIPDALFAAARTLGPLAVAVANPAGAALLRRKQWHEQPLLQRWVWKRGDKHFQEDKHFFTHVCQPHDVQSPAGYLWQQPYLNSMVYHWGDEAQLVLDAAGIRLISCTQPTACVQWAIQNGFNWIDFVTNFTSVQQQASLQAAGFSMHTNFPWYLNPPDFNRTITLNWFTEDPLPEGFVFKRSYADMTRVGSISLST